MSSVSRLLLLLATASLIASCGGKSSPASWDSSSATLPDTVAPSRPGALVATAMGATSASLNWNASTDNMAVVSYVISRNGAQVATSTTTSYVDSGLSPATTYSYNVAALDEAGNLSPNSATANVTTPALADTTPPSQPTGLTATAAGAVGANLSWNASTDNVGVSGYIVSRNGAQVATPAATSFADTGLSPATTYTYAVVARDAAGNLSSAASVSVTTGTPADTTPPSQPTGLTGTASGTSAGLSWNASTDNVGVTGYIVTRNGTQVATPATTSFSDPGLAPATYAYTVAARDAAGNRSSTASVSVTIADAVAPSQPGAFTATAASSVLVNLSWSASTDNVGVTGYIVTRNGTQIATPTTTTFADTGLTPSTTYTYTVVARDAAGNRSTAASTSATTPATVTKTVDLTWDPVVASNLSGYRIYYGTASRTYTRTLSTGLVTTFPVPGLLSGNRYFFAVAAFDSAGNESPLSNEVFSDIP